MRVRILLLFLLLLADGARPVLAEARQPWFSRKPLGRLNPAQRLEIGLSLPLRNTNALGKLLRDLYDPNGPRFRRFLTPEEFTRAFAPAPQDYDALARFAETNGFRVTHRHSSRTLLTVEAPVTDIERMFRVRLNLYGHPTENRTFFGCDSEPSFDRMPVRLLQISGLNNFAAPRPRNLRPAAARRALPRLGSGPFGEFLGEDFRKAYLPGSTLTGAGQSVALVEFDGYFESDISDYKTLAGLPDVPLEKVLIDGFSGSPLGRFPGSGNEEVALDIETTISMAPGLDRVLVYEVSPAATGATIDHLLNRIAADNRAKQISCSWALDVDASMQQSLLQMAAQGQSFFLASGDDGAFSGPVVQPSDSPFMTIVGGTILDVDDLGGWKSERAWDGSGGGISTLFPIPEWQRGIDMSVNGGSATMRNLPDVAMLADNVLAIVDRGRTDTFLGTSISSPLWAGFTALVNEQAAAEGLPPVGFLNPALYAIGKSSARATAFHDVTTGDNTTGDSPDAFFAVPGFDLCTGWGTPGTNLIRALLAPPLDPLAILPPLGVSIIATDAPPALSARAFILTNSGSAALSWTAGCDAPWLELSPPSGAIPPHGSATVFATPIASHVAQVLIGEFHAELRFTNGSSGVVQTRAFDLSRGNGGFELGSFGGWVFTGNTRSNLVVSIDFAEFLGTARLRRIGNALLIHSGIYGAFLGESRLPGRLEQSLATEPGRQYRLSFWLSNPEEGGTNEFSVAWDGQSLLSLTNSGAFSWTNLQFSVTASSASTALQFAFRNDLKAFALDDISLVETSAPLLAQISCQGDTVEVHWTGPAGAVTRLEFSDDLNPANWQVLGEPVVLANGSASVTQPLDGASHRYYRVSADLPVSPPQKP